MLQFLSFAICRLATVVVDGRVLTPALTRTYSDPSRAGDNCRFMGAAGLYSRRVLNTFRSKLVNAGRISKVLNA